MRRLEAAFSAHAPRLVPFLTVGDPDLTRTADLVVAMARAGADLIELGIPYSDPVADGPTIQASSQRALDRGVRLADVFEVVRRIRRDSDVPLILFTYCNPVFRYGLDRFMREAAAAGADGVLMPDLPPEEATELCAAAEAYGLATVFLVAPTTTDERIATLVAASSGFLYLVATTGVTGARSALAQDLVRNVARVRARTQLPIAVGFGISTPEQASEVVRMGADAVVVGSALVERIARWAAEPDLLDRISGFVSDLKAGLAPVEA